MIITIVNNIPQSGRSTLCIGLANSIAAKNYDAENPVIVFDCDPKLPLFDKFSKEMANRSHILKEYQVIPLSIKNEEILYRTLAERRKCPGYHLFDLPVNIDEWFYIRLFISSNFIVVPLTESSLTDGSGKEFLIYSIRTARALQEMKTGVKARLLIVPVSSHKNKNSDVFFESLNSGKEQIGRYFTVTPGVAMGEKLIEQLSFKGFEENQTEIFKPFSDYMLKLIEEVNKSANKSTFQQNS